MCSNVTRTTLGIECTLRIDIAPIRYLQHCKRAIEGCSLASLNLNNLACNHPQAPLLLPMLTGAQSYM